MTHLARVLGASAFVVAFSEVVAEVRTAPSVKLIKHQVEFLAERNDSALGNLIR